jgi:hypothetical protein
VDISLQDQLNFDSIIKVKKINVVHLQKLLVKRRDERRLMYPDLILQVILQLQSPMYEEGIEEKKYHEKSDPIHQLPHRRTKSKRMILKLDPAQQPKYIEKGIRKRLILEPVLRLLFKWRISTLKNAQLEEI